MILTVLPERDSSDAETQKLRKHMRWALNELSLDDSQQRLIQCVNGCLAQNLDAALQFFSASGYETVIVAGARMFLSLALMLRPCMRPTRYVVFLGSHDAADVPCTVIEDVDAASHSNGRCRLSQMWQSLRCSCKASAQQQPYPDTPPDTVLPLVRVPMPPRCTVLLIDTSNGDTKMMPWRMYLHRAIETTGTVYDWVSTLSGHTAAARDGARMVDFLR